METARKYLAKHGIPNMQTQFVLEHQTEITDTLKALEGYHRSKLNDFKDWLNNTLGYNGSLDDEIEVYLEEINT